MLPSANMSMAVRTIRLGELVNSGLTHPKPTEASQNDRNTSIEMVPSRACSCRAQNDLGGPRLGSAGSRGASGLATASGARCVRSSMRDRSSSS